MTAVAGYVGLVFGVASLELISFAVRSSGAKLPFFVVDKLFVTAGQIVKKGDIVARISLRPSPATIDGTVLDTPNKEGAFIVETSTFQSGTTVATLADMNDMIFEGLVDESEVGKLREGMQLVLNVGAPEGKPFVATLEFISPKGTTDQGTIKFTTHAAAKLNKELFLRSNYSANADIVLASKADVLAINEGDLIIEDKPRSWKSRRHHRCFRSGRSRSDCRMASTSRLSPG